MTKQKAIFLDRDGTIIEDLGCLKRTSQISFYSGTFKALILLQKEFLLFIVTNQEGIAKGMASYDEVRAVNMAIEDRLKSEGVKIAKTYVCPHSKEDGCHCRKPNPYFLKKAANDFNIDLSKSYMIGDHPSDVYCAENAGATGIYLFTGHGLKHLHEFDRKPECSPDILDAADYIMNQ